MIEFEIVVVPPGGGEAEYNAPMKASRVPQSSEYIQLKEDDGLSIFLVRNIISVFEDDDSPIKNFNESKIIAEVEPIDYEMQSDTQARMIDRYRRKGFEVKKWIASGY